MVPQFRPQAALTFLKGFVDGNMLAPLLPNNKTLMEFSEVDFYKSMEAWTESAMGAPYVDDLSSKDETISVA